MKKVTYGVALSNDQCIFDSQDGFGTPEEALSWASGRGGSYVVQIENSRDSELGISVNAICTDHGMSYRYYDGLEWRWRDISVAEIIEKVK